MKSPLARFVLPAAMAGLVFAGAHALLRAQGPAREMTLDFLALTADGAPIPDLKAEDLTLRIGGRPRTIKSLKLVDFGGGGGAAAPAADAKPAGPAPPFGTNVGAAPGGGDATARAYLFLVDTESIRPSVEKMLRDSIDKVVSALTPRDRVGLITVPRPTLNVPLTSNHAAFRTALAQLAAAGSQMNAVCRTREVLDMVKNVVGALSPAEGPYNVLLMSNSLSSTGTGGGCEVTTSDFQRMPSVLAAARARMYVVHATDTVAERNDGLEQMAGVAGAGAVMRLAAGGDNPLSRIPRETAQHYVLTFEVEPAERTGQLSRLELRTARSGATIRASSEIALSKADTATPGAAAGGAVAPRQMLTSTANFTALPLRAVGYVARGAEGRNNIITMLEAVEPGVKLTAVSAGIVDSSGKIVHSGAADEKQLASATIVMALTGAPGTYRLRVAATDDKGRSGAVDYPVNAELVALGPSVKFGGIILGAPTGGCAPRMQFTNEENLCAVLEMYGPPTGPMTATLEIVPIGGGKPIVSAGMGGAQVADDRFSLSVAQVPIGSLAPGDYTVRAVIGMQGAGEAVITRTLRKVAK